MLNKWYGAGEYVLEEEEILGCGAKCSQLLCTWMERMRPASVSWWCHIPRHINLSSFQTSSSTASPPFRKNTPQANFHPDTQPLPATDLQGSYTQTVTPLSSQLAFSTSKVYSSHFQLLRITNYDQSLHFVCTSSYYKIPDGHLTYHSSVLNPLRQIYYFFTISLTAQQYILLYAHYVCRCATYI